MNLSKLVLLPQAAVKTHAPIHYEANPYNWFLIRAEDSALYAKFLQSLEENPPEVMAKSGFVGVVPFDYGYRGAITGKTNPLLGEWTSQPADPQTGWGRLPPDQLSQRIGLIEQYIQDLHGQGNVKRVMPYIDFGTKIHGRHARPPNVPQSVWGFWEFYDHWEDYAEPAGAFELGLKPLDPVTWLSRQPDPTIKQSVTGWPELPDELTGFRFAHCPINPDLYGPTYRYSVCLNTQGWALWWKQVIQWMAYVGYDGAFIDEAYMTPCWNQECQAGYQQWLAANYTPAEIQRYFTTTTKKTESLLLDSSIEMGWLQETPGKWRTPYWNALTGSIFPDTDAYSGLYSCRIEGPGNAGVVTFGPISQKVPAAQDLRLTFYYKTEGVVDVKLHIYAAVAQPFMRVLGLTGDWTQQMIDLTTLADASGTVQFVLRFEVTGTGSVWLDEFWLGQANQPQAFEVALETAIVDKALRSWAAKAYWAHVADQKLGYLRQQAQLVNPEFKLFANGFHAVNADYFMCERGAIDLNYYRTDIGFFPGLYRPYTPPVTIKKNENALLEITEPYLVTNIFDYKYIHSRRVPGFFGYHIPQWIYAADNGFYEHNPDTALLNLAEVAAFGGGAGCDTGLRHNYARYNSDATLLSGDAVPIRATEKQFWKFIQAHQHRYNGYNTHADVGIVYHDLSFTELDEFHQILDLAKSLAGRGVLWDVLTENRCNAQSFVHLHVLIYQDVAQISAAEAQAVLNFIAQGGLVLAAGAVGDIDEWFRMRLPNPANVWPPVGQPPDANKVRARPAAFEQQSGTGRLIYQPMPFTADQVITAMEGHLGRKVQMVNNLSAEAIEWLRLNAWIRTEGNDTITLHIVNYDVPLDKNKSLGQVQVLNNVQVSVPTPPGMKVNSVWLCSPESDDPPQPVQFTITNGLITFPIASLRIYTVAVIE